MATPPTPPIAPPPSPPLVGLAPPSRDERTWGMLCHLAALAGNIIPFGGIIGPLVIWLIKKDEYPFVNDQGKESLNFQITMLIIFLACIPLCFVLIGIPLIIAAGIYSLVMVIIATVRSNDGQAYRYPFRIQFFS
jgi:uncharacterized Tic20 family protein